VYDADITRLSNPDYDAVMEKAVTGFLHHAEEEENEQFKAIRSKLSPEQNDVRFPSHYTRCLYTC
jgi:hypothetical protein